MNCKFKSILCLLLALTSLLVFAGCKGNGDGGGSTIAPNVGGGPVDESDPWANYAQEVGIKDYDGQRLTVASVAYDNHSFFTGSCGEEEIGYPVADEIYARDTLISEQYGIDIFYLPPDTSTDGTELCSSLKTSIMGNAFICDTVNGNINTVLQPLFNANCLYDINQLSTVKPYDTPWWASYFSEGASYKDHLYYAANMSNGGAYFGTAYVMICNTVMEKEIYFEDGTQMDILQLIDDNEWTLETMNEIVEACFALDYADKNSSVSVYEDKMVYANCYNEVTAAAHYIAAGGKYSTIDVDGNIVVDLATEDVLSLSSKLADFFDQVAHNSDHSAYFPGSGGAAEGWQSEQIVAFINGRSLFFGNSMTYVNNLTNMEDDYAIIPCPMADKWQGAYISAINSWSPGFMGVARNNSDADFVGYAIEMMSYHAYYMVRPIVYDQTLCSRLARDPQQVEIMDEIFANLYVDLNCLNDWSSTYTIVSKGCYDSTFNLSVELPKIKNLDTQIQKFDSFIDSITQPE